MLPDLENMILGKSVKEEPKKISMSNIMEGLKDESKSTVDLGSSLVGAITGIKSIQST